MIWIFKEAQMPLRVQQLGPFNILWKSLSESVFIITEPWLLRGTFFIFTIQLSICSCLFMQLAQRHFHFIPPSLWLVCFTSHSSDKLLSVPFFFPSSFFSSLYGVISSLFVINFVLYYLQELNNYRFGFMKIKFLLLVMAFRIRQWNAFSFYSAKLYLRLCVVGFFFKVVIILLESTLEV